MVFAVVSKTAAIKLLRSSLKTTGSVVSNAILEPVIVVANTEPYSEFPASLKATMILFKLESNVAAMSYVPAVVGGS